MLLEIIFLLFSAQIETSKTHGCRYLKNYYLVILSHIMTFSLFLQNKQHKILKND